MSCIGKSIVFAFALMLVSATVFAEADVAKGKRLYTRYCASCHGVNGDGHGPVASALKTPPADLRILSKRYGDPLPEEQIARFIDGRADVQAHGPREMPIWGDRVWAYQKEGERKEHHAVSDRIADLVAYLQSIQKVREQARLEQSLDSLDRRANR
jgi:mono/diheme cytochrome c family protein